MPLWSSNTQRDSLVLRGVCEIQLSAACLSTS